MPTPPDLTSSPYYANKNYTYNNAPTRRPLSRHANICVIGHYRLICLLKFMFPSSCTFLLLVSLLPLVNTVLNDTSYPDFILRPTFNSRYLFHAFVVMSLTTKIPVIRLLIISSWDCTSVVMMLYHFVVETSNLALSGLTRSRSDLAMPKMK
ncbi:hypothetical protein LOAG_08770 [Loa loa]|uniref:Uncharacterized protein n=1 Tax=Loa loa TaxID=7209 RepID=A0A1S0TTM1_LOALO|nr:hypothetical protein LOAG_08770 [Loa loa]EFO19722.1 hypothetical protein LOAG_08770 [Loa loa]